METAEDWASSAEQRLLEAAIRQVGESGWSTRLLYAAAKTAGLSPPEADLLLPHGPQDLAALLSARHNAGMTARLADIDPAPLKIRERIRAAIWARAEAAMAEEPATRACAGFLALPSNLPLAGRLMWRSADLVWRWAGDTSTDQNHYSKRLIAAGLIASTLAVRLSNTSEAAGVHLDRGIDAVMAYEKAKARFGGAAFVDRLAAKLGALRYDASVTPAAD